MAFEIIWLTSNRNSDGDIVKWIFQKGQHSKGEYVSLSTAKGQISESASIVMHL